MPIQKCKQNSYLGQKEFNEYEIISKLFFKSISND